ncbi:MAG: TetR/AcrR family transcriptional regulator [Bacteroidales bacterium]|nr:TetR/AcrR family transcriptional regulator [Muribaculaceae bacterium]MCI6856292.1 TetR/AcrR family transcriptional regulator [Bacteroidales bacterium]MDY4943426.1 TetR/AcrR family transcriptional regulator [Candidatus Limisoma sp.]MDD7604376.1 TetR/AcrR family transcriptional regulator [Bacteroidales bacterium]MDD7759919.1 TetR/AcrR family transcriptional regulator [Bacteroidales bacterium]
MSKTRDKLIDIARQLFAHKGIENTTMNDIAQAAEKGRRTIYTYFKNKKDIYNAVIESESDKVIKKLSEIVSLSITPDQKLMEFIFQRFEAMKDLVYRNGSLRAGFFRDVRKVERARKATSPKEIRILETILQEGVDQGMFRIKHVDKTAMVMLLCLQGLDVPYIRDNFQELGIEKNKLRDYLYDFILYGIKQ